MTYSILINNYNYEKYLPEALDSCLMQNRDLLKEIIVVDDGSVDNSRSILDSYSKEHGDILKVVYQDNGGQLSAMRRGVLESSGDILCFMDSDDSFSTDRYLELLEKYYRRYNADCVFVGQEYNFEGTDTGYRYRKFRYRRFFRSTFYIARYVKAWFGQNTSTMSMTSEIARKISTLPVEFDKDWITRADNVYVYGVSYFGGSKLFLKEKAVNYRIHESNAFFGKKLSQSEREQDQLSKMAFMKHWDLENYRQPSVKGIGHEYLSLLPYRFHALERYRSTLKDFDEFQGRGNRFWYFVMTLAILPGLMLRRAVYYRNRLKKKLRGRKKES